MTDLINKIQEEFQELRLVDQDNSKEYLEGYTDALNNAFTIVKKLIIHSVVSRCCDETKKD